MVKTEQAQLLKHDASITRLEKLVSVISRRLIAVEKENARLKHALARTNNSMATVEHKLK
jgi:hypothetical protein